MAAWQYGCIRLAKNFQEPREFEQGMLTQRDVMVVHFSGLLTKHLLKQPFLLESQ